MTGASSAGGNESRISAASRGDKRSRRSAILGVLRVASACWTVACRACRSGVLIAIRHVDGLREQAPSSRRGDQCRPAATARNANVTDRIGTRGVRT